MGRLNGFLIFAAYYERFQTCVCAKYENKLNERNIPAKRTISV